MVDITGIDKLSISQLRSKIIEYDIDCSHCYKKDDFLLALKSKHTSQFKERQEIHENKYSQDEDEYDELSKISGVRAYPKKKKTVEPVVNKQPKVKEYIDYNQDYIQDGDDIRTNEEKEMDKFGLPIPPLYESKYNLPPVLNEDGVEVKDEEGEDFEPVDPEEKITQIFDRLKAFGMGLGDAEIEKVREQFRVAQEQHAAKYPNSKKAKKAKAEKDAKREIEEEEKKEREKEREAKMEDAKRRLKEKKELEKQEEMAKLNEERRAKLKAQEEEAQRKPSIAERDLSEEF